MGEAEDGSEGIVVHAAGLPRRSHGANEFRFMSTEVSRERPVNYEELAARLVEEKRAAGYLVWVVGPALVHSRARADFEWFIGNGYVQAVLAGNAVAVHDIEAAIFGTTLGMTNTGQPTRGRPRAAHARHQPRCARPARSSAAVESGLVRTRHHARAGDPGIPYVLAGSIRDDGPLPGVHHRHPGRAGRHAGAHRAGHRRHLRRDRAARHRGRQHAAGVPYHTADGRPEPLMTICVDQTEFVVNKLKDRGTHQAYGVVTNAQDFMHVLRFYVRAMLNRPARARSRRGAPTGPASPRGSANSCRRREIDGGLGLLAPPPRRQGMGHRGPRRVEGDRRRIYTAHYSARSRARSAAGSRRSCEEVGSGPSRRCDGTARS